MIAFVALHSFTLIFIYLISFYHDFIVILFIWLLLPFEWLAQSGAVISADSNASSIKVIESAVCVVRVIIILGFV